MFDHSGNSVSTFDLTFPPRGQREESLIFEPDDVPFGRASGDGDGDGVVGEHFAVSFFQPIIQRYFFQLQV